MGWWRPVIDVYHIITQQLVAQPVSFIKVLTAARHLAIRQDVKDDLVLNSLRYGAIVAALP